MIRGIQHSLKAKLFVLFFTMNLGVILLVGVISYQSKRDAIEEQVVNNLTMMSSELADKVDRFLSARLNDTNAIALHYSLFNQKTTTSSQNTVLAKYLKIYPYYEHISIINLNDVKTPRAKTPGGAEPWYMPAVNGQVVSSDMVLSPLTDKPTMSFAAPVKDASGKVVSILTTNLNIAYLWDIVDQIGVENKNNGLSGYAFMMNRDGLLIAHPDKRKVLFEQALREKKEIFAEAMTALKEGRPAHVHYTYEGVAKMAVISPCNGFGDFKGHGWSLAVTYSRSDMLAPLHQLLRKYIWIFLLTSIVALFVSTQLANYIVKPILALKAGASRIGAGNFSLRIGVGTKDEIGDLASSFNQMAETLETRDNQLKEYTWTLTRINQELGVKQEELHQANEVLKRTNDELLRLEKHKAEFTAMITHDIKAPLSTVITYSEMILNGTIAEGGDTLRKAINSIHASGYKILSLVDNFLVSSAIEAGRLQLYIKPLDINDFVEDEVPFFTPQMEKKNISFAFNKALGLPQVMADKVQLDRALSNIISNAIKFTPPNGRITISTSQSADFVSVTVEDTGKGITASEIDSIFTKYKRADSAAKVEGLGLGLFISKAIVEAHGGSITVTSRPGEGSAFTIQLPRGVPPNAGQTR